MCDKCDKLPKTGISGMNVMSNYETSSSHKSQKEPSPFYAVYYNHREFENSRKRREGKKQGLKSIEGTLLC